MPATTAAITTSPMEPKCMPSARVYVKRRPARIERTWPRWLLVLAEVRLLIIVVEL